MFNNKRKDSRRFCTHCGKQEGKNAKCRRCWVVNAVWQRPDPSQEKVEVALRAFDEQTMTESQKVMGIISTIRFASPSVKAQLRSVLLEVLAEDFKKANSGKWQGEAALGYAVGDFIGNLTSNN